ncbi:MAG TPA: RluA family pseudouridine synthase [Clostridiaceae bacterium]|nr:RluA family pseudouridine synthase [Clostridiaceae bacterium]
MEDLEDVENIEDTKETEDPEEREEINITADKSGVRIDALLSSNIEKYSRTYFQKLIENGMVKVNGKNVKSNYKVKLDDKISVQIPKPQKLDVKAENIDIDVLYEDDDILIVNKPKGMVVHPAAGNYSGTLVNALMAYCGDSLSDINGVIRPGIVHRIDKDTSGVLVVAKNNAAHEGLSALLKKHDIKRIYIAVVYGIIREDSGRIEAPIGRHPTERKKMAVNTKNGRHAVTHFRVLERFKDCTYVELRLETGRTHQIRVHMSYIGHPLVGDAVYGSKKQKYNVDGQALHAKVLGFVHPGTGEYMEFEAEIPEYFKKLLEELRNS